MLYSNIPIAYQNGLKLIPPHIKAKTFDTGQMKFFIKNSFIKCDQIRRKLQILFFVQCDLSQVIYVPKPVYRLSKKATSTRVEADKKTLSDDHIMWPLP